MTATTNTPPHERPNFPEQFQGFWRSLERNRISFPRCEDCGKVHWYPMPRCPHCLSDRLGWRAVEGGATLYSWTVVRRSFSPEFTAPYVVGLVEFAEVPGTRLITNIVDAPEDALSVGMALTPIFLTTDRDVPAVHFRPAGAAHG